VPLFESAMSPIESFENVATGVAALVAAWVAWKGLQAWRVQLHGKTEYDLARRVLRAVFKVRDQIAFVRHPFVAVGETIEAYRAAGIDLADVDLLKDDKRATQLVYQKRWQPLAAAVSDLSVEILEAEVLWGRSSRDLEADLRKLVAELNTAVTLYHRDIHVQHGDAERAIKASERLENWSAIVYGGVSDDVFAKRVESVVDRLEAMLRPHLKTGYSVRVRDAA
jgi:hypothetical protein